MAKKNKKNTSFIQALIVLFLISVTAYMVLRAVFVAYAEYELIGKILGVLFFVSELYVVIHAFGFFFGLYRLTTKEKTEPAMVELDSFPAVAILIPVRHEPADILENTIISCYNLSYPAKTIYILDDSSLDKYKIEAKEIAERYGCQLFRRPDRHGAKAGVINDCMKNITEKYIAIFDVDQNPIDGFLMKTVSILEANEQLALIQTPQYYSNMADSKVAMGANMQQATFYEIVCEGKSVNDAMMCCGTNVVLRRQALEDVGGFDETTVTEDFATSFQMHLKGWKTLYYNHVSTFGLGPENLGSYLSQQNRWAMGNVAVLKKVIARFFKSPRSLSVLQWWEYFITGSYYFVGWAVLFLLTCPMIYIFFDVPSFFMNPVVYSVSFLPYIILSSYIYYFSMRERNYRSRDIFKGQLLFFLSIPAYMRGTLFGLIGIKKGFQITPKRGGPKISYIKLWPQILLWSVNLMAITWAVNRFMYDYSPAVIVNAIWITYHFTLLSSLFYFNEEWS
jgi:cellulose synthase (UDP-forming)